MYLRSCKLLKTKTRHFYLTLTRDSKVISYLGRLSKQITMKIGKEKKLGENFLDSRH
jgi:hypothetical protein